MVEGEVCFLIVRVWVLKFFNLGKKNKKVNIHAGNLGGLICESYTHKQMFLLLVVYETYTYELKVDI
jgi:hypothetical protein